MTDQYKNNLEHIQEELQRIDLLIDIQVIKFRHDNKIMDGYQGIYISDEEVDSLLNPNGQNSLNENDKSINNLKRNLIHFESKIAQKKIKSSENGVKLRLSFLANIFDLSPFELDCILVCLAPALDLKYEKLYAYLNDDVTKKLPTVNLVLNLLCNSPKD